MLSTLLALFRKKGKKSNPKKLNSATAKKVLQFLSHGLTYGAESLSAQYQPNSKVNEFVAVCGAILNGLQPHATELTDSVTISVHVNDLQKEIRLMQLGEHVMLVLDGCETVISCTTLDQIYTSLREDIMKHEEIYGQRLQSTAASCPPSRN